MTIGAMGVIQNKSDGWGRWIGPIRSRSGALSIGRVRARWVFVAVLLIELRRDG